MQAIMQREINWRLIIVFAIAVVAAILMTPSVGYFYSLATVPYPERDEFDSQDAYTSATVAYEALMTEKREGYRFIGRPIPLGLDLQGGSDVLLAVDVSKVIETELSLLAGQIRSELSKDELAAIVDLNDSKDAIRVRVEDPDVAKAVGIILTSEFKTAFQSFNVADLNDTDNGLLLRFETDQAAFYARNSIDGAKTIIEKRVNSLGVTMPTVVKVGPDRIRVQVPGEKDPKRVMDEVIRPADLAFHMVHQSQDTLIHDTLQFDEYGKVIAGQVPTGYVIMQGEVREPMASRENNPRGTKFEIIPRLDQPDVTKEVGLYVVKEQSELTGRLLADARYFFNPQAMGGSNHEVNIRFNREGRKIFRDVTEKYLQQDMAIVLEGEVISAPTLIAYIADGRARITGAFQPDEAQFLALVLRAGAITAPLESIGEQQVGPTLGADSIRQGFTALIVGSILVVLFMLAYYVGGGVLAILALLVNVAVIMAVLALCRATLTLSGIAGMLLTVGMAVDANVLIFERMREEFKLTNSLKVAINRGFGKAFSTIFDANVTTLVTALILLQFGTSSMQGFALTMTFGIFATLFTGLYVTRVYADTWARKHDSLNLGALHLLDGVNIDFISLRFGAYVLSAVLLLAGIGGIIHNKGLNLGVDFSGGVTATVEMKSADVTDAHVREVVGGAVKVQGVKGTRDFLLTTKIDDDKKLEEVKNELMSKLDASDLGAYTVIGVDGVSGTVGGEFKQRAFVCIFISALSILLYIWFRFELAFGAAAVVALFHDIILTLGVIEVLEIEISLEVVAALLMVFGYSINDTIVVFDRIRENMLGLFGKRIKDLINTSINQCLSRTVITSITTLLAVVSMVWLGGEGLRDFSLTLLIGLFIGTYSSSFVASPILYEWRKRRPTAGLRPTDSDSGSSGSGGGGSSRADAPSTGSTAPRKSGKKSDQGPRTRGVRVDPIR